ncbi:glycosyltransferase family 4 protein [Selenomonas ruminantium]|uniref:Galacturonosyltransferase n=1 Tax=Selenomonas ruminantium TaxID=971 RepID=A0A1H3WQ26_SELRU|nr:glycosyltransferase family 4 protein [Selenomonas ruminantium]SDZ89060.1 galacturonosyltransferase [Selenomonas ruminantium]
MRIVILANSDAGLYKFRKELLERCCTDHKVMIILPYGEYIGDLESIGCQYIPIEFNRRGTNPLADIKLIKRYIRLLKEVNPDVVLTYTIKPNIYGGIACQCLHIPYISNITGLGTAIENGGLLKLLTSILYKYGLKSSKCVFFQNSKNQNDFISRGIVRGKNRLIPGSGVNLAQYKYEDYPLEIEGIRFLFVGRIMRDKGIEELLTAMTEIRKKYNNVILDVVGWCDEDYTVALKKAVQKGTICYYGFQKNMYKFYKNCHCVILPSYHEGLANVLLEASAIGRPVITTNIPGCQETFVEGKTGYGCEPKSACSLRLAVDRFLSLTHEDRKQMGKEARKKIEAEFDRRIVVEAYMKELEALNC